jgi:hypothetical protein
MEKKYSSLRRRWAEARSIWDESAFRSQTELSRPHKFAHFCLMVWRSFIRNRCPVRASALAYGSLLALIPVLAVAMSITSTFLKKEGEKRIDQFIVKLVSTLTPPATLHSSTNDPESDNLDSLEGLTNTVSSSNAVQSIPETQKETSAGNSISPTKALPAFAQEEKAVQTRKEIARRINEFIQKTRSGA